MTKDFEVFDGVIDIGEDIRDFNLGDIGSIPNLAKQDDIIFEYNQYKKPTWSSDCTLFGPFGALSDLLNIKFTDENIESIRTLAKERGKKDNKGRYTQLGVKVVVDRWNTNNKNKILYFKGNLLSDDVLEALGLGYSVVVTFRGNSAYNKDIYADGVVDGIDFDPSTYGHCIKIRMIDGKIMAVDSAAGIVSYNKYELKDLRGLVKKGTYYPTAYVILEERKIEKSKEELARLSRMRFLAEQNIANNSELRHLTNDINFKTRLHDNNNRYRQKLSDIDTELVK